MKHPKAASNRNTKSTTPSSREPLISIAPSMKQRMPPLNANTKSNRNNNRTKARLKCNNGGKQLPNTTVNGTWKSVKKPVCRNSRWCSRRTVGSKSKTQLVEKVSEFYSGSSMSFASPAPSLLPMPNFSSKKIVS